MDTATKKQDSNLQRSLALLREESSKKNNKRKQLFSASGKDRLEGWISDKVLELEDDYNVDTERDMFLDFNAATSIYPEQITLNMKQKQNKIPGVARAQAAIESSTTAGLTVTSATSAAVTAPTKTSSSLHQKSKSSSQNTVLPMQTIHKGNARSFRSEETVSTKMTRIGKTMKKSSSADAILKRSTPDSFLRRDDKRISKQYGTIHEQRTKHKLSKTGSKTSSSSFMQEGSAAWGGLSEKAKKRMQRSRPWRTSDSNQPLLSPNKNHSKDGVISSILQGWRDQVKETQKSQGNAQRCSGPEDDRKLTNDKVAVNRKPKSNDAIVKDEIQTAENGIINGACEPQTHENELGCKSLDDYLFEQGIKQPFNAYHSLLSRVSHETKEPASSKGVNSKKDDDEENEKRGWTLHHYGHEEEKDNFLVNCDQGSSDHFQEVEQYTPAFHTHFGFNVTTKDGYLKIQDPLQTSNQEHLPTPGSDVDVGAKNLGNANYGSQISKNTDPLLKKAVVGSPEKQQRMLKGVGHRYLKRASTKLRARSAPFKLQSGKMKPQTVDKVWGRDKKISPSQKDMGSYRKIYRTSSTLANTKKSFLNKPTQNERMSIMEPQLATPDTEDNTAIGDGDKQYEEYEGSPSITNTINMPSLVKNKCNRPEHYQNVRLEEKRSPKNKIISGMSPCVIISEEQDEDENYYAFENPMEAFSSFPHRQRDKRYMQNRKSEKHRPFALTKKNYSLERAGRSSAYGESGNSFSPLHSKISGKDLASKAENPMPLGGGYSEREKYEIVSGQPQHGDQILNYYDQLINAIGNEENYGNKVVPNARFKRTPMEDRGAKGNHLTPYTKRTLRQGSGSLRTGRLSPREITKKSDKNYVSIDWLITSDGQGQGHRRDDRSEKAMISNCGYQTHGDDVAFPSGFDDFGFADDVGVDCYNRSGGIVCDALDAGACGKDRSHIKDYNTQMKREDGSDHSGNTVSDSNFKHKNHDGNDHENQSKYSDDFDEVIGDHWYKIKDCVNQHDKENNIHHVTTQHLPQISSHHRQCRLPTSQNLPPVDKKILRDLDNVLTTLFLETRVAAMKAKKVKVLLDETMSRNPNAIGDDTGDFGNGNGDIELKHDDTDNEWEGTFGDFLLLFGFMMVQLSIHLAIERLGVK